MAWNTSYNEAFSPLTEQTFTVGQFLDMVSELISPLKVTIQGEITSFDIRGTNIFATISDTKEQAKLELYIYKPTLDRMGIVLEEGMEVIIKGTPSIYKPYGKFSLRVSHVSLVGEGQLKAAFDRLVGKLQAEGLFDQALKREIPAFPINIGVISSERGDALFDFRKHLLPFNLKIHFVDARVEGVNAIESITEALNTLNQSNVPLDVIVLTRGGGSLESLQAFNSEPVARAIRASRVPVISAVGHEQDVTIADYVADLRASTPTDAAKVLSQNWSKASERVQLLESSLMSNFRKSVSLVQQRLEGLLAGMFSGYQQELYVKQSTIKHAQSSAINYLQQVQFVSQKLEKEFAYNIKTVESAIVEGKRHAFHEVMTLGLSIRNIVTQTNQKLENFERLIESNDPHNRLKQGYSIVTDASGKVVKSSENVKVGENINIKLMKGGLETEIKNKTN